MMPKNYIATHDITGETHEGTAKELATVLKVVPTTIYKMALQGKKIAGHWLIRKESAEQAVGKLDNKFSQELQNEWDEVTKPYKMERMCYATHSSEKKDAEKRKKNKKNITNIAVEARKAGMSYGQYVAKMGL